MILATGTTMSKQRRYHQDHCAVQVRMIHMLSRRYTRPKRKSPMLDSSILRTLDLSAHFWMNLRNRLGRSWCTVVRSNSEENNLPEPQK